MLRLRPLHMGRFVCAGRWSYNVEAALLCCCVYLLLFCCAVVMLLCCTVLQKNSTVTNVSRVLLMARWVGSLVYVRTSVCRCVCTHGCVACVLREKKSAPPFAVLKKKKKCKSSALYIWVSSAVSVCRSVCTHGCVACVLREKKMQGLRPLQF